MIVIMDLENKIVYNQSRTEAGVLNITDLKRLARYTINVNAVNNQDNMSSSEKEFISISLCKFDNSFHIIVQL